MKEIKNIKKIKKITTGFLGLALCAVILAGCGTTQETQTEMASGELSQEDSGNGNAEEQQDNAWGSMPDFNTEDLLGNAVTNDIFAEADLTVVNVWGTFCGPCINEMPELAEWSDAMPENVQIIGIVGDIAGKEDTEHLELAKTIVDEAGVNFTNIIPNDDLETFMRGIYGYPTTFFVDGEGNIVGDPVIGAYVDTYKNFVEEYLNE